MATDESSALSNETSREAPGETGPPTAESIDYDEVNLGLTAGYKPTITVGLIVGLSFVLLGGVIPGLAGGGGGMTTMTYTVVGWGIIVGSLGFVYEFWIGHNRESTND